MRSHLPGVLVDDSLRHGHDLVVAVELETRQRIGNQEGRMIGLLSQRSPIHGESATLVTLGEQLLALLDELSGTWRHRFEGRGLAGQVGHEILVAHLARTESLRLAERIERLAIPVAIEIAETEDVVTLLQTGIQPDGFTEVLDRRRQAAHLVVTLPQEQERPRQSLDRNQHAPGRRPPFPGRPSPPRPHPGQTTARTSRDRD